MDYRHENTQHHLEKVDARPFKRETRLALELSGRQRKVVCMELGIDKAQLSRWESDDCPASIPSHLLPTWTREVGPRLLAYVAMEAGYDLIATSCIAHTIEDPAALVALLSRQSGAAVADTLGDIRSGGVWDDDEKATALVRFLKIQQIVAGIVDSLQAVQHQQAVGQ